MAKQNLLIAPGPSRQRGLLRPRGLLLLCVHLVIVIIVVAVARLAAAAVAAFIEADGRGGEPAAVRCRRRISLPRIAFNPDPRRGLHDLATASLSIDKRS